VQCRELATTNLLVEGTPSILYYTPDRLSSVMVHLPAPAYGVYLSQLIRDSRACGSYQDFLDRGFLLTRKLLKQWFLLVKLKSSLRKFNGRHPAMVDAMEYLCHKWPRICSLVVSTSLSFPHLWLITGFVTRLTRQRVPLMEQELPTLPEHLNSSPVLTGVRVILSLVLCVLFF
jgi:hypothetical protein